MTPAFFSPNAYLEARSTDWQTWETMGLIRYEGGAIVVRSDPVADAIRERFAAPAHAPHETTAEHALGH